MRRDYVVRLALLTIALGSGLAAGVVANRDTAATASGASSGVQACIDLSRDALADVPMDTVYDPEANMLTVSGPARLYRLDITDPACRTASPLVAAIIDDAVTSHRADMAGQCQAMRDAIEENRLEERGLTVDLAAAASFVDRWCA